MRRWGRTTEFVAVSLLVGLAAGGLALEAALGQAEDPASRPLAQKLFVERALFCPPNPEGSDATVDLSVGPTDEDPLLIDIEPGGEGTQELHQRIVKRSFAEPTNAFVVSYGKFAAATVATSYREPEEGIGAAPCSNSAARRWFFPQGSSARGFNQRLVFYNPFPDEAVVSVRFLTPEGPRSKANLADIPVPSEGATTVPVNRFILQQPVLASEVEAVRGRIVAWKTVFFDPDDGSPGVGSTVGARDGSTEWYFPSGASGENINERISVLNPTDREAIVTISLIAEEERPQPDSLLEVAIDRRSSKSFSITKALAGERFDALSAIVRSENGVPILAERSVAYDTDEVRGLTLELGAPRASPSWWVGPAAPDPDRDLLVLLNVGQEEATVELDLLTTDETGGRRLNLSDLTIPAGGRTILRLDRMTDEAAVVLVRASTSVIAERFATSKDPDAVASLMGIPID